MYKNTWIVVANASKARIFEATSNQSLQEHEALVNPKAHSKGTDLISDKPGRSFDRSGVGRHGLESGQSLEDELAEEFSRHVAGAIKTIDNEGKLKQIYLLASPEFLGFLRHHICPTLKPKISGTVDKDLTKMSGDEIRKYLPEVI